MQVKRRASPPTWRRQFNESFCSPDGSFSITKTVAIAGQILVMYWTGREFDTLIRHETSLFICLSVLIAPDILKKALIMWISTKGAK